MATSRAAYMREYRKKRSQDPNYRQARRDETRRWFLAVRREVLLDLGLECAGCGEDEFAVLTVDHIHGGGNAHRRALNKNGNSRNGVSGYTFYKAILAEGLPRDKYRVLCWNCQHRAKMGIPFPWERDMQGPMNKTTAESGPPSAPNDAFRTLPQKDSRVDRNEPGRVKGSGVKPG